MQQFSPENLKNFFGLTSAWRWIFLRSRDHRPQWSTGMAGVGQRRGGKLSAIYRVRICVLRPGLPIAALRFILDRGCVRRIGRGAAERNPTTATHAHLSAAARAAPIAALRPRYGALRLAIAIFERLHGRALEFAVSLTFFEVLTFVELSLSFADTDRDFHSAVLPIERQRHESITFD